MISKYERNSKAFAILGIWVGVFILAQPANLEGRLVMLPFAVISTFIVITWKLHLLIERVWPMVAGSIFFIWIAWCSVAYTGNIGFAFATGAAAVSTALLLSPFVLINELFEDKKGGNNKTVTG